MLRCISHTCLIASLTSAYSPAQTDQSPRFEVASVKPVTRDARMGYSENAEFVRYTRLPLTNLISEAYNVELDQIIGPEWLSTEFYAITAKLPPGATKAQRPQMVANLLAERFGLIVHRIAKDVTGYELTIAPGGPRQLIPANPKTAADAPPDVPGRGGFERPKAGVNGFPVLGPGLKWAANFDNGMEKITFRGSMASLAFWVRGTLFESPYGDGGTVPITDRTGVSGTFDFHLEIPSPPCGSPRWSGSKRDKPSPETAIPALVRATSPQRLKNNWV